MPAVLAPALLLLLVFYTTSNRVQALSMVSASPCFCPQLETLAHTVSVACASPVVAALPQMAAACGLAATLKGELTAARRSNQTNLKKQTIAPLARPTTKVQHASSTNAGAGYTIPFIPSIPARPKQAGDMHDSSRFRRRRIFSAPKHRQRRTAASAADVNCSLNATLQSLQTHCAVPGCIWSTQSYEQDLSLACSDATAVVVPFNHTTCPSLAEPCTVEIYFNVASTSVHGVTSLQNAAALLDIWQSSASVTLRGQWDAPGLSAVLQHAHKLTELDAASAGLSSLTSDTLAGLSAFATLDLSGNQLTRLPHGLFQELSNLTSLDLDNNKLADIDATAFQGLSALDTLVLNGNQLTRLPHGLFQGLSNLTVLDLDNNKLTDIDATAFQGLSALDYVDLSGNQLTHLPEGLFQGLSSLTLLHLEYNKLTDIGATAFQGLSALDYVDLSGNQLTRLPEGLFQKLSNLIWLNLRSNKLTAIDATAFQGFSALNDLSLSGNQLTRLPDGLLQGLSKLTRLYLHNNKLTDIDATAFQGLSALYTLVLNGNRLIRLPDGLFQGLSSLTGLYLANNTLTDIDATAFQGLSALNDLSLSGNQLTRLLHGLFQGLSKLTELDLGSNKLSNLHANDLEELSALQVLNISSNPLNRLSQRRLVLPAQLSSLSQLWLESTSISILQLPENSELEYLTLAQSRQLTAVLPRSTRVAVADVTGTALHIADLPCDSIGFQSLVARSVQHTTTLELLDNCMGSERQYLDVSDNSEHRVGAVRESLSTVASSFLMGNASWTLYPGREPVRQTRIGLILVASPVQCSIGMVQHYVLFQESDDIVYYTEPLEMFTCSCIPGYYEHHGACYKAVPFVATAGGIVTVVLATLLVTGLLVLCHGRYKQRLHHARHDLEMQRGLLDYAETEVLALKRVWELEAEDVTLVKRIDAGSEGAFGAVWRGDWDGMVVAVKILRAGLLELDSTLADEFDREAQFLMRARHSNVVRFFGAGRMPGGEPFVVLELVSRGSMRGLLRGDEGSQLDQGVKQRLAVDVTRGMAYIHSLGALHRDLKSGNVLVTENWRGKVADFGSMRTLLAAAAAGNDPGAGDAVKVVSGSRSNAASSGRASHARDMTLTAGVGTPLYMAPEVLRGDDYGEAADVWAFGVMVWELVEQRAPDLLVEMGEQGRGPMLGRLLKLLEAGKRLQLGEGAPAWAQRIVTECTVAEASERPTFVVLQQRLLLKAESDGAGGWTGGGE